MNELQRQHYLSALGVDTYMPRWQLPFAPVAVICETTGLIEAPVLESSVIKNDDSNRRQQDISTSEPKIEIGIPAQSNNVLNDILEQKKLLASNPQPISAADILANLVAKPANIDAFSLSI